MHSGIFFWLVLGSDEEGAGAWEAACKNFFDETSNFWVLFAFNSNRAKSTKFWKPSEAPTRPTAAFVTQLNANKTNSWWTIFLLASPTVLNLISDSACTSRRMNWIDCVLERVNAEASACFSSARRLIATRIEVTPICFIIKLTHEGSSNSSFYSFLSSLPSF